VQQAVGANVTVSSSDASNTVVSYEGKIPLVFGFQAIQLMFDGTTYQRFRVLPAGAGGMKGMKRLTRAKRKGKGNSGRTKGPAAEGIAMPLSDGLVRLTDFE
jgi:hypothetical protein